LEFGASLLDVVSFDDAIRQICTCREKNEVLILEDDRGIIRSILTTLKRSTAIFLSTSIRF
jgi:hypothetical protein